MLKSIVIFFFLICCTPLLYSQIGVDSTDTEINNDTLREAPQAEGLIISDSTEAKVASDEELKKLHSPKKATIMSAILPGLGQAYNKKYWKIPIIYAGFAAAGYYLNDNLTNIKEFKALYNTDPTSNNYFYEGRNYSQEQVLSIIDQYTRWRDLSYITFGAIYILNIIDANVDAHLFYFDISEDISMNILPYSDFTAQRSTGLTLRFKL